jgi:hypothetical protein
VLRLRGQGVAVEPDERSSSGEVEPRAPGSIPVTANVLLTGKSFGPPSAAAELRPRGSRTARLRSGPPSVWPAVSTATSSDPPPTSASAPRRLIVGSAGVGATRPYRSGSSGRVAAVEVRSSARNDRDRSPRTMCGSLSATCATKAPRNTQAPT